jgi:uncharacterized surface anchored protein
VTDDGGATASDEMLATVDQSDGGGPESGSLTVMTIDADGLPLGGACFGLYADQGPEVANTCDTADGSDDGTTVFKNVPAGSYVVMQTDAQPGYSLADAQPVWVAAGEESTVTMQNMP